MPSTTSRVGWREVAAAIGMFGLGFVVVAGVVHLGMRNPQYLHADMRSEKLAILKERSGTVCSASFGSSHVHNGFDPRAFDLTMAGSPEQTRTLNLAIAGGSQTEQRMTALEFLKHIQTPTQTGATPKDQMAPRACILILELAAGANFTNDHLVHPRAINIYDWPTTKFVLQLTSPQMGTKQRWGRVGYALAAMGLHYLNVGMLSSNIFPAPLDQQMLHDETTDDRRGLLVLPKVAPGFERISKTIADAPKQPTVTQGTIVPGNRELVEELEAASPVRTMRIAYVVMPKIADLAETIAYPDSVETANGPVPILNLARPDLYPQIYDAKLWYDEAHLNENGAQLATKLLAESLKNWYATHAAQTTGGR